MDGKEALERVRGAIARRKKRRIKSAFNDFLDDLDDLLCDAEDPKPEPVDNAGPGYTPPPAPPNYPKLIGPRIPPGEYLTVNSDAEWQAHHDKHVYFPPSQPANLPVTTTLEAEKAKLQAQGCTERPAEEWERRKATKGYTVKEASIG